jgi:hypothetical protein
MPIIDTLEKFNALPLQYLDMKSIEDFELNTVYFAEHDDIYHQLLPLEDQLNPGRISSWFFRWNEVKFSLVPMPGYCATFVRSSSENILMLVHRNFCLGPTKLPERDRCLKELEYGHHIPVTLYS